MFACCNLFVSFTILFLFCLKSIKPIHSVENVNQTVKRFSHFILPIGSSFNTLQQNYQYPPYYGNPYISDILLLAGSKLNGDGIDIDITFQQFPFRHDITVMLNGTGLPVGKHALHIHSYGDLGNECRNTGGQFRHTFLGNIEGKEDGNVSLIFMRTYLSLFGYSGIIGRSVVVHKKPLDFNNLLNADAMPSLPNISYIQYEEKTLGEVIACGIISIMENQKFKEN